MNTSFKHWIMRPIELDEMTHDNSSSIFIENNSSLDGIFAMCSHYVPSKLSMGSHQVPHMFPNFPMCSPNMFSIAPHFYLICFWQMLSSLHLHRWAKGEELYTSKNNLLFWGASVVSFFEWWADQIGSFYILGYLLELIIKIWHIGKQIFQNLVNFPKKLANLFSMENPWDGSKSYLSGQNLAKFRPKIIIKFIIIKF